MESLLLIVLLVAAILLMRWLASSLRGGVRDDSWGMSADRSTAREIFDERYARGEIDREEYQRMRRDLAE